MVLKRKDTLSETAGVSKRMLAVADAIARKIAGEDVLKILDDTRLIDDWHEGYSETYDGEINVNGETYQYEIFYNSKNRGESSSDVIGVNFSVIEDLMEELDTKIEQTSYGYYDDEEEEFDSTAYAEDAKYCYPSYYLEAYQAIFSVALHELTHTLNPDSDPLDRLWVKQTKWNYEDVRNILYLFSKSEMNSRVASASAVFLNYYKLNQSGKAVKDAWNSGKQNRFFSDVLMPYVMNDRELQVREMQSWVDMLKSEIGNVSQEYLSQFISEGRSYSTLFSLPFHLAINEDGLYKRSNPRSVLNIYARDPEAFENKVYSFYNRELQAYKQRIYKVCWYVFNNNEWEDKGLYDWMDQTGNKFWDGQ